MTFFSALRTQLLVLVSAAALGFAAAGPAQASGVAVALDTFPTNKLTDKAALQHGAKLFMNYCLGCHSISQVRYNKLRELGLTEEQIKGNLILTNAKFGDLITTTMPRTDAKTWFGKAPPDLSLTARSRSGPEGTGADWIYTYLRTYYVDEARPTGWNNRTYPNVGMPNVLWGLQGVNRPSYKKVSEHGEEHMVFDKFVQETPGSLNVADFDNHIADLTAFLAWTAEPSGLERRQIGVWVLLFLAVFFVFAWRLNASFWRDIR